MRGFTFFGICIVAAIFFMYKDSNNTVYDTWYHKDAKEISLFGDTVTTLKMKAAEDAGEEYFVLYDSKKHGMFCSEIVGSKALYICTPTEFKNKKIYEDDDLIKVTKNASPKKAFFAHAIMRNYLVVKILKMEISSLDNNCFDLKACDFKEMDTYVSFKYDFMKRLYVSHLHDID